MPANNGQPVASSQTGTVSVPTRQPRSTDELPTDINGTPVKIFDMPEPTVVAFKRSQLQRMTPEQYRENAAAIQEAKEHNLIIDDTTNPAVFEAQDKALRASADRMLAAVAKRDAKLKVDESLKNWQAAQNELEFVKRSGDDYALLGAEQKVVDTNKQLNDAHAAFKELTQVVTAD